jgi:hypothetical protein
LLQDLKPKNVLVTKISGKKEFFVIDGDFYFNFNNKQSEKK